MIIYNTTTFDAASGIDGIVSATGLEALAIVLGYHFVVERTRVTVAFESSILAVSTQRYHFFWIAAEDVVIRIGSGVDV